MEVSGCGDWGVSQRPAVRFGRRDSGRRLNSKKVETGLEKLLFPGRLTARGAGPARLWIKGELPEESSGELSRESGPPAVRFPTLKEKGRRGKSFAVERTAPKFCWSGRFARRSSERGVVTRVEAVISSSK